jgi:hypothetical protein
MRDLQALDPTERAVVGNDDALAGLEARGDFDLAVIAAAEANGTALGRSAVRATTKT